jgi:hypothetical protein
LITDGVLPPAHPFFSAAFVSPDMENGNFALAESVAE